MLQTFQNIVYTYPLSVVTKTRKSFIITLYSRRIFLECLLKTSIDFPRFVTFSSIDSELLISSFSFFVVGFCFMKINNLLAEGAQYLLNMSSEHIGE